MLSSEKIEVIQLIDRLFRLSEPVQYIAAVNYYLGGLNLTKEQKKKLLPKLYKYL